MNLIKKVQENIFHHELFPRGARIVVGVSGGLDSVCLLDTLCKLKNKYDLELVVAHVNYGLRGKDSEKDEKLARNLAEKHSLPIEIKSVASHKLRATEENLRKIRYTFFEKARKKHKADFVAVAHNLNDQAETVMMRILRGTGLRGIEAIRFRNEKIVRPLLNISRKDILAYLRKNKLEYRIDKTNLEADFTRNKIRNELFPYLEKEFNPRVQELLYRLSRSAAADYAFIRRYAKAWLAQNRILRASEIKDLHPAVQREVIRLAIKEHESDLAEIESPHIDEILKIVRSSKNKRQSMRIKGLKIERKGDKLVIARNV